MRKFKSSALKVPHGEIPRYTWFDISIRENKALQCKMKHMKEGQHCYLSIKLVLLKGWGEGPQGLSYQLLMLNWVSILKFDLRKETTGHCLVTHDWYHRLKNNKGSDSLLIFLLFGYFWVVQISLTFWCQWSYAFFDLLQGPHWSRTYIYEKEKLIGLKPNESEGPLIPPKPEANIPLSSEKKGSLPTLMCGARIAISAED